MKTEKIWKDQKPDKHFWAFYYYCKRRGDDVWIETQPNGNKILIVTYENGGEKVFDG